MKTVPLLLVALLTGCSQGPALCVRPPSVWPYAEAAVQVGTTMQFAAGQLDILGECDRAAPPDVRWRSGVPTVAAVDDSGRLQALRPGRGSATSLPAS